MTQQRESIAFFLWIIGLWVCDPSEMMAIGALMTQGEHFSDSRLVLNSYSGNHGWWTLGEGSLALMEHLGEYRAWLWGFLCMFSYLILITALWSRYWCPNWIARGAEACQGHVVVMKAGRQHSPCLRTPAPSVHCTTWGHCSGKGCFLLIMLCAS